MADLGMSAADATINPAIENNAYTDTGSHRDIKQWGLVFACAPGGFSQSSGVGIVFNGRSHAKRLLQITDGILASPVRKEIYVAELSTDRIDRSGRPNTDSANLSATLRRQRSQYFANGVH